MTEWCIAVWLRLKALARRNRLDADLEEELAFHRAMQEDRNRGAGVDRDENVMAIRRQFGNSTVIKERCRNEWRFTALEGLWTDVRQALRSFRRTPVFAVIAVLSLAVGIGANATVYSVMNALFLRSLPVHQPERLRILNWTSAGDVPVDSTSGYGDYQSGRQTSSSFSYEALREFQKRAGGFDAIFGFCDIRMNAVARSHAWISDGLAVSANFFQALGTEPVLGRAFQPNDDRTGAVPVAIISYRLWEQEFGATQRCWVRR